MEKLYSSSDARKKLRVSTSTFKRLVDSGRIRKITPPGKVQGMYVREDVDRIAEEMAQFERIYLATEPVERMETVQAKNESDIRETVQIARQHFGENAYSVEKRMEWFKRVPNGDYVLKHEGVIVGYFSMQALKAGAVNRIFKLKQDSPLHLEASDGREHILGEERDSVQIDDLEPIQAGHPIELYVSGIGVKTGISRQQAKIYGMYLLHGLFDALIKLGEQGIQIDKIWAKSSTVPGMKLSRDLGFADLGYINNEQVGFVLDPQTSELPAAKKYREALQQSKKLLLK